MIQKILQHLEVEDDDVPQVNNKVFAVDEHLQEKQLSPPMAPSVDSIAYANGNGTSKSTDKAAASGKTNFISTKMKLLNCADIHTLDPMPCAAHSVELNTNVSNIQNKRRHSEEAASHIWELQMSNPYC